MQSLVYATELATYIHTNSVIHTHYMHTNVYMYINMYTFLIKYTHILQTYSHFYKCTLLRNKQNCDNFMYILFCLYCFPAVFLLFFLNYEQC